MDSLQKMLVSRIKREVKKYFIIDDMSKYDFVEVGEPRYLILPTKDIGYTFKEFTNEILEIELTSGDRAKHLSDQDKNLITESIHKWITKYEESKKQ